MHQHHILHRDIKAENVLVFVQDGKILLKYCDFGSSKLSQNAYSQTLVGTIYYLSPQLVSGQPYTAKTDIWSLGVLLYRLFCLKDPFTGGLMEIVEKI